MKSDVMGIGAPINEKELKELLKETKETIAVGVKINGSNNPVFGAIDLWNVQRKQRTSSSMTRRLLN